MSRLVSKEAPVLGGLQTRLKANDAPGRVWAAGPAFRQALSGVWIGIHLLFTSRCYAL
jgi:hypothetical protein